MRALSTTISKRFNKSSLLVQQVAVRRQLPDTEKNLLLREKVPLFVCRCPSSIVLTPSGVLTLVIHYFCIVVMVGGTHLEAIAFAPHVTGYRAARASV
jgi:hypothetical protein